MRRVFAAIGVIAVAIVLLAAAGLGYAFYEGGKLDKQAAAYSVEAVAAITAHWDESALRSRAAPPLAASLTNDQGTRVFTWLSSLGPLQDSPTCQGNATVYAGTGGGKTTANVTCTAQYKAGPATIQLALSKTFGVWMILGFHVTSPVLLPQQPSQKA